MPGGLVRTIGLAVALDLAVVGLGPRGLSVLERLCANAPGTGRALTVHLVDPHLADGGQVWRRTQRPELLMNTVACQVGVFPDDSVDCDGPVVTGPSLYEWARSTATGLVDLPARARAEARALGPNAYSTRSLYGHYLRWTLEHLVRAAPPGVRVVRHASQAVDLRDEPGGAQRIALRDGTVLTGLHAVVLAQGHLPHEPGADEVASLRFAERHGLHHVPPGNPAEADLDPIGPGETVVLRGMGLNFFDHLALLTEGRGGRFERDRAGRVVYRPSGREPRLVAGSRRGVPYRSRGENQKGAFGRHEPLFLTPYVVRRLRTAADLGSPVDFRRDVWPLIDLEVRAVYYAALVRDEAFTPAFVAAARPRRPQDPFDVRESAAQRELLTAYGVDRALWWDWRRIDTPYPPEALVSTGAFRRWLRAEVADDVREARRGNVDSPVKAVLDVLRDVRNEVRQVVDHGGLSGDSYRDDLQRWYTPLNAYLSIGPPADRVEQLAALLDSGVLEVLGPRLEVARAPGGRFVARSAAIPDVEVEATALVEARLPEVDLHRTTDPLVRNLLARGECRAHRIPVRGGGCYTTGGMAVGRRPYRLLDAADRPHPRRFAFGVPTETVHWVTAAGIRPGVNSVILGDADAVARASIRAAADAVVDVPAARVAT
ncbi:FAD/NAD(P)-binding protein [Actinosynnema sp. NPDC020468]|uniref:FAD/NAD(P)-binding protein n=1 Tax=Actinosynnema sp. NPDC020468 TaxID=3154488 RepID=UPI0033D595CB